MCKITVHAWHQKKNSKDRHNKTISLQINMGIVSLIAKKMRHIDMLMRIAHPLKSEHC